MAVLLFSAAAVLSSQEAAADPDPAPGVHADHDGWTAINQAYIDTNGLPTDAGNYYLSEDDHVTVTSGTWTLKGDGTLCLNGKDILSNTSRSLTVSGGTLTICDCDATKVRYGYWDEGNFTVSDAAPG